MRKLLTKRKVFLALATLTLLKMWWGPLVQPEGYVVAHKQVVVGATPNFPNASNEGIIRLYNKNEKQAFCSAFVVDGLYAFTAAHCLNDGGYILKDTIKIYNSDGKDTGVEAKAISYETRTDLGVIKGDFRNFKPLPAELIHNSIELTASQEGFGQIPIIVAACGFAQGQKQATCNNLILSGIHLTGFVGIGYLSPGMSGGPVVNMKTGKVIGVVMGYSGDHYQFVQIKPTPRNSRIV